MRNSSLHMSVPGNHQMRNLLLHIWRAIAAPEPARPLARDLPEARVAVGRLGDARHPLDGHDPRRAVTTL